ncbi:TVP38/TMEM64 family protein, partial [Streptococcus pneumoniae]|nr:TVP38/TMEM64 family protein [Streptococcus pneumoniae]
MSQDKQMKAVSPLLQRVINISSIVGGVGSLIFCICANQAG